MPNQIKIHQHDLIREIKTIPLEYFPNLLQLIRVKFTGISSNDKQMATIPGQDYSVWSSVSSNMIHYIEANALPCRNAEAAIVCPQKTDRHSTIRPAHERAADARPYPSG